MNSTPIEAPSSGVDVELAPPRPVEKSANGGFREVIGTESTAEKEPAPVPPAKDPPNPGPVQSLLRPILVTYGPIRSPTSLSLPGLALVTARVSGHILPESA